MAALFSENENDNPCTSESLLECSKCTANTAPDWCHGLCISGKNVARQCRRSAGQESLYCWQHRIKPSDIIFSDQRVAILKQGLTDKGIIIWHDVGSAPIARICKEGLKTPAVLREEKYDLGDRVDKGIIYFRVPHQNPTPFPDIYKRDDTSMLRYYGSNDKSNKVFIRVDPDQTSIFYSEDRVNTMSPYIPSRGTLTSHLKQLRHLNTQVDGGKISSVNPRAYDYKTEVTDYATLVRGNREFTSTWVRNFEICVHVPFIKPEWFVSCGDESLLRQ